MNKHYTYFLILAFSIAGPLALSFDKKVAFYKKLKYVFPAMLVPALLYIIWDIYFTSKGVWSFNERYISGIKIANLPVEEVLFFFVIPYCCIFIYECVKTYFPSLRNTMLADSLMNLTGALLLISGSFFYNRHYTSWTFTFCGVFILAVYVFKRYISAFNSRLFLVSYGIMIIPFLIVNGFLTSIPVVLYNNRENLGIRIFSIPFEDCFYGMLLILMSVVIYETLSSIANRQPPTADR